MVKNKKKIQFHITITMYIKLIIRNTTILMWKTSLKVSESKSTEPSPVKSSIIINNGYPKVFLETF